MNTGKNKQVLWTLANIGKSFQFQFNLGWEYDGTISQLCNSYNDPKFICDVK